jgi:hypothetical protein
MYLKLRISEKFRSAKESWHKVPGHYGVEIVLRRNWIACSRYRAWSAAYRLRVPFVFLRPHIPLGWMALSIYLFIIHETAPSIPKGYAA